MVLYLISQAMVLYLLSQAMVLYLLSQAMVLYLISQSSFVLKELFFHLQEKLRVFSAVLMVTFRHGAGHSCN